MLVTLYALRDVEHLALKAAELHNALLMRKQSNPGMTATAARLLNMAIQPDEEIEITTVSGTPVVVDRQNAYILRPQDADENGLDFFYIRRDDMPADAVRFKVVVDWTQYASEED